MNRLEDLEKAGKMVFIEEENSDPDKTIEKEQNAINDFIASLDEEVFKDLSRFPLKLPEKITYPKFIKMDDFILLSAGDDFYLFPKMFKDKISDYLEYKEYFNREKTLSRLFYKKMLKPLPRKERYKCLFKSDKMLDFSAWATGISLLIGLIILGKVSSSLIQFIVVAVLLLITVVLYFLVWRRNRISDEIAYINFQEEFTELLSQFKTMKFPLEFFDKCNGDIKVIRSLYPDYK